MTTAAEIIKQAYLEIKAVAASEPIPPDQYEVAYQRLNYLIDSEPLIPNFTALTSSSDEITSPSYCNRWMIKALALDLAPQFGQLESYGIVERQMTEAYSVILRSLSRIGPPQLNGNVPMGSGNITPGSRYGNRYYRETDNGILTETNAEIIVEDSTP
jgi:hypothetical protein